MIRENTAVPPADPLLAWVMAELEEREAQDEYPQTQLINQEGTSIEHA